MRKYYRLIFLIVAAVGLLDSLYLTYIKLSNNAALCIQGVGDCWSVNTSVYSEIYGLPISILGALAYISLILLMVLESKVNWEKNILYAIFGITLIGLLYSVYLSYLEIAVIRAICPFCVISGIAMLILFSISFDRLVTGQEANNP